MSSFRQPPKFSSKILVISCAIGKDGDAGRKLFFLYPVFHYYIKHNEIYLLSQTCMYHESIGLEGMIKNERTSNFPEKLCWVCAVPHQGPMVALTSVLWWLTQT